MKISARLLTLLLWASCPFLLPACYIAPAGGPVMAGPPGGGPPPHAPAHGYRRNHVYRYYPDAQVYFSPERGSYFYLDGGAWRVGVTLPYELRVRLGNHVEVEIDSEEPYRYFDKHKSQYPPGKYKKKWRN